MDGTSRGKLVTASALVACALVPTAASAVKPHDGSYSGIETGSGTIEDLEIGLRLDTGEVDRTNLAFEYGASCSSGGSGPGPGQIDAKKRFRMTYSDVNVSEVLRGQFTSKREVEGTFKYTSFSLCPGTYKTKFVARSFRKTHGHEPKPKSGRYAGAADDAYVWFRVQQGQITQFTDVVAFFPNCTRNFHISPSSPIDSQGNYQVEDLDSDDDVVVGGHFTNRHAAVGTINWLIDDPCPLGPYEFPYNAGRVGPL